MCVRNENSQNSSTHAGRISTMTATVVAPLPVPAPAELSISDSSAEARKRRREIIASQRHVAPDTVASTDLGDSTRKKRKVSTDDESSSISSKKPAKKPQMKYDPDVPMTKEEAAAWRREQRRKRNRESAAASRQRQRDRITELEREVGEWKTKYENIMAKIRELEEAAGTTLVEIGPAGTRSETPEPQEAKTITPRASPTSSTSLHPAGEEDGDSQSVKEEELELLPSKMISRPA